MTKQELKEKARSLPLVPGVYLMHDKSGQIIYVGKAKKLKNRVSQYFQETASHTPKTRKMVSCVDDFEVIAARTEFEALVLECSLIKRHMPKYNILLKDAKGYPYLRLDLRQDYPTITLENRAQDDGAQYFGPFASRGVTQHLLDTLRLTFRLPGCHKQFPRDLGKARPCLNYDMGNCDGWCQLRCTQADYHARMTQVAAVLQGRYQQVAKQLRQEMEQAAEDLAFERAAALRDQLAAVTTLGEKQLVTAGTMADTDVIGYCDNGTRACFAVLHFVGGNLLDKDYEILDAADSAPDAISSLVKQYYLARRAAPRLILLPQPMEDAAPFSQLLYEQLGKRVTLRVPQRGDHLRRLSIAQANAKEELERVTTKQERRQQLLLQLQQLLGLETCPDRMESYDISHIDGTDIVASMVVFRGGRPSKQDYKRFKLRDMSDQNDIAAMRQVLRRRFTHYLAGDAGFAEKPDLVLIDGGATHAAAACQELASLGLALPVYGMVKDSRHRTRALLTPDGRETSVTAVPALFALIGQVQEETHRFAITYHRQLRSRRLQASELDALPGVGPARKAALLRHFKTLRAIREADVAALSEIVPRTVAETIYTHYHPTVPTP